MYILDIGKIVYDYSHISNQESGIGKRLFFKNNRHNKQSWYICNTLQAT